MKASIYCLLSTFLFLFCGCWWLEEDDCTKLDRSITVSISGEIVDKTLDQSRCVHKYRFDFDKDHCGGGLRSTMNYFYRGCSEFEGLTYVQKDGIGSWDITFDYQEDMFYFNLLEDNGNNICSGSVTAETIYDHTYEGRDGLLISFYLEEKSALYYVN